MMSKSPLGVRTREILLGYLISYSADVVEYRHGSVPCLLTLGCCWEKMAAD